MRRTWSAHSSLRMCLLSYPMKIQTRDAHVGLQQNTNCLTKIGYSVDFHNRRMSRTKSQTLRYHAHISLGQPRILYLAGLVLPIPRNCADCTKVPAILTSFSYPFGTARTSVGRLGESSLAERTYNVIAFCMSASILVGLSRAQFVPNSHFFRAFRTCPWRTFASSSSVWRN